MQSVEGRARPHPHLPRAHHSDDVIDLVEDGAGDNLGAGGPFAKDAVDLGRVGHQAVHLGRDGRQHADGKFRKPGLEGAELGACMLGNHRNGGKPREGYVDVHQIARLGPVFQAVERVGQRLGVGLGLADLGGDGVGIVGQVDAALVEGSDFDIFFDPSRKLMTRVAAPSITGSVMGKKFTP